MIIIPAYDTQESKQAIYAIVAEQGSAAVLKKPGGGTITYDDATDQTAFIFLVGATTASRDASKTINRTDMVGTQLQRVSEGSVQLSLSLDMLALRPATLGDTTVAFAGSAGDVAHGIDIDTTPTTGTGVKQYALSSHGADKLINSTNTVTIRVFQDCSLDANEDANITTAKQIVDYEKCHLSGVSFSIPGGGDVSVTINLDAEKVTYPTAYDALPN